MPCSSWQCPCSERITADGCGPQSRAHLDCQNPSRGAGGGGGGGVHAPQQPSVGAVPRPTTPPCPLLPTPVRRRWRSGDALQRWPPAPRSPSISQTPPSPQRGVPRGCIAMEPPPLSSSNLCQAARELHVRPPLPYLNRWIPSILLPAAPWLNVMRREPLPPLLEPHGEERLEEAEERGPRRLLQPQGRPQILLENAEGANPQQRRQNPAAARAGEAAAARAAGAAAARVAAAVAAANAVALRLGMQHLAGVAALGAGGGGNAGEEVEAAAGEGSGDVQHGARVSNGARLLERLAHALRNPRPTFCPRAASARWPSRSVNQRARATVRGGVRPVSVPANYRQRSRLNSARRRAGEPGGGRAELGGARRVRLHRSMSNHLGWLTSGAVSLWRGFDRSVRPRAKLRAMLRRLQRVVTGYITMLPDALTYAADHAGDVPGFQLATLPLVPTRSHFREPTAPTPPPQSTVSTTTIPPSTSPSPTTPRPWKSAKRRNLTRYDVGVDAGGPTLETLRPPRSARHLHRHQHKRRQASAGTVEGRVRHRSGGHCSTFRTAGNKRPQRSCTSGQRLFLIQRHLVAMQERRERLRQRTISNLQPRRAFSAQPKFNPETLNLELFEEGKPTSALMRLLLSQVSHQQPRKHATRCVTSAKAKRTKKRSSHKRKVSFHPVEIAATRDTGTSPFPSAQKCDCELGQSRLLDCPYGMVGTSERFHPRDRRVRALVRRSASKALSDTFPSGGKKRRRHRVRGNVSHLPVPDDVSVKTMKVSNSAEIRRVDSDSQSKEQQVESKSSSSLLSNVLSKILNVLGAVFIAGPSETTLQNDRPGDEGTALNQTASVNSDKRDIGVEESVLYRSSSFYGVGKQNVDKRTITAIDCIAHNRSLKNSESLLSMSSEPQCVRNQNTRVKSVDMEMSPFLSGAVDEKIKHFGTKKRHKKRRGVFNSSKEFLKTTTPTSHSKSLNIIATQNHPRDQKVQSRTQILERKLSEFFVKDYEKGYSTRMLAKAQNKRYSTESEHLPQVNIEGSEVCNSDIKIYEPQQFFNSVESKSSDVSTSLFSCIEYLKRSDQILNERNELIDLSAKNCKQMESQSIENENEFTHQEFVKSLVSLRSKQSRHKQVHHYREESQKFSYDFEENETAIELNEQWSPTYSASTQQFRGQESGELSVISDSDKCKTVPSYQRGTENYYPTDLGFYTRNIWKSLSVSSVALDSDTPRNKTECPRLPHVYDISFQKTYSVLRCDNTTPTIFKEHDREDDNKPPTRSTTGDVREIEKRTNLRETRSYECAPLHRTIDCDRRIPRSLSFLFSSLNRELSDNKTVKSVEQMRENDQNRIYRRNVPTCITGYENCPNKIFRLPSKHRLRKYANLMHGKSMEHVRHKESGSENDSLRNCRETKTETEILGTNVRRRSKNGHPWNNGVCKRRKKTEKRFPSCGRNKISKMGKGNIENVERLGHTVSADESVTKEPSSNVYSHECDTNSKDTYQPKIEKKCGDKNVSYATPVGNSCLDSTTSSTASSCLPLNLLASTHLLNRILWRTYTNETPVFTEVIGDTDIHSRANSDTTTCLRNSSSLGFTSEVFPQRSITCLLVNPDTPPHLPETPKELCFTKCLPRSPNPSARRSQTVTPESSTYPNSTLPSSVVRTPTSSMVSSSKSKTRIGASNINFLDSFPEHISNTIPSNTNNSEGNNTDSDPRLLGYVPTESCFLPFIPLQDNYEVPTTDSAAPNSYFTAEVAPESLLSDSNISSALPEHYFSASADVQEPVPQEVTENDQIHRDIIKSAYVKLVNASHSMEDWYALTRENSTSLQSRNLHNHFATKLYDIPENDASCSSEVGSRPLSAPEGNATYSICSSSDVVGRTFTVRGSTEDTDRVCKQRDLSRDSSNSLILTPVASVVLEELPEDTASVYSNAEGEAMDITEKLKSREISIAPPQVVSSVSAAFNAYDYKSLVSCLDRHATLLQEIGAARGIVNLPQRPPASSLGDRTIDRKEYLNVLRQHLQLVRAVCPRMSLENSTDRPSIAAALLLL